MMAADCAALARESAMGILFSRGTTIEPEAVHCLRHQEITGEGTGTIAVSSILSPNTLLLIGQGGTLEMFKHRMAASLGARLNLKKADGVWPPLHTPILWQRNVWNRAGVIMQRMTGGLKIPTPNILSLVTGRMSYTRSMRDTIVQWLDHPQKLWDVICEVLGMAIETVVHIGPDPNLVPATFERPSDNVLAQRASTSFSRWGRSAVSFMARRPWLTPVLSTRAVLLRALRGARDSGRLAAGPGRAISYAGPSIATYGNADRCSPIVAKPITSS